MPITRHVTTLTTAVAALSLAACGGEQRLSDQELSAKLKPVVERIGTEYGAVFAALGRAEEGARVPAGVRGRLPAVADVEREAAEQVDALVPPESAEDAVDALADGARRHAATLERLAGDRGLTVAEMADALEQGEIAGPLRRLVKAGLVDPPAHR